MGPVGGEPSQAFFDEEGKSKPTEHTCVYHRPSPLVEDSI